MFIRAYVVKYIKPELYENIKAGSLYKVAFTNDKGEEVYFYIDVKVWDTTTKANTLLYEVNAMDFNFRPFGTDMGEIAIKKEFFYDSLTEIANTNVGFY